MLVELTIRQWTARKYDRTVSREVDQTHSAKDGGRYNKQLISKAALASISALAGTIRDFHYESTLPWGDNGQRLLPATKFLAYRQEITRLRREFDTLVKSFLQRYPDEVDAARHRLGTLFNPLDYPPMQTVHESFGVSFDIFPVPTSNDFRVEVAGIERGELEAQVEALTIKRQKAATAACYARARTVLERVATQCVAGKTRITESMVGSVYALVDSLADLNIAQDPGLEDLRQDIERNLTVSADGLRQFEDVRLRVGGRAAHLLTLLPAE